MKNHGTFMIERTYDAPVEKVWEALTDRERMKEWYFDIPEFRPEPGFEFSFEADCDGAFYLHHCRVTEVIPHKKLAYTWRYEGYEGNSLVTFELFAENGKTRLKLTHEGLETFPQDDPHFAAENFAGGWNEITGVYLEKYLEKTLSEA